MRRALRRHDILNIVVRHDVVELERSMSVAIEKQQPGVP
jgi:hypothetical protein